MIRAQASFGDERTLRELSFPLDGNKNPIKYTLSGDDLVVCPCITCSHSLELEKFKVSHPVIENIHQLMIQVHPSVLILGSSQKIKITLDDNGV